MANMIADIVRGLAGDNDDARDAARERLRDLQESGELQAGHCAALVRAAAGVGPGEREWSDPSSAVLFAARDLARRAPGPEIVEAVRRSFPELRPDPRAAALQVLTSVPTVESARAYTQLLCAHAGQIRSLGSVTFSAKNRGPFGPTPATPEIAECLFPAVLAATSNEGLRYSLYIMLLEFLEEGMVNPRELAPHEREFVRHFGEQLRGVREHQRENAPGRLNWKYESPYEDFRDMAGLMLDIAGWWATEPILEAVGGFADTSDPRLRAFTAIALLRAGRRVAPTELERIAQSPRERFMLHRVLTEMGKGDDLPPACRDQAGLAEGHMVDWLCFGTELGREPDEIELVHVETRRTGGGLLRRGRPTDYFFFRFRVTEEHWSNDQGWTVGVAGGYQRTEGGTTMHDGHTFSHFTEWEEKPLREHVAEYLD